MGLRTELNCQVENFWLSLIRRDNGEQSRLQSCHGDNTVGVNRRAWRILQLRVSKIKRSEGYNTYRL